VSASAGWDAAYRRGQAPWDTGRPSAELQRVVSEDGLMGGRALELGCGTGTNALWLAEQGFEVTALDFSAVAIEQARARAGEAGEAGTRVRFLVADVLEAPPVEGPFDFFFDRGCYHVVRQHDAEGYLRLLRLLTASGSRGLVIAGNAREPTAGPPVVSEAELRDELGSLFRIERLREFRFDELAGGFGRPLAWSCLLSRD
jgi:SAM-dependent methyltransferase